MAVVRRKFEPISRDAISAHAPNDVFSVQRIDLSRRIEWLLSKISAMQCIAGSTFCVRATVPSLVGEVPTCVEEGLLHAIVHALEQRTRQAL